GDERHAGAFELPDAFRRDDECRGAVREQDRRDQMRDVLHDRVVLRRGGLDRYDKDAARLAGAHHVAREAQAGHAAETAVEIQFLLLAIERETELVNQFAGDSRLGPAARRRGDDMRDVRRRTPPVRKRRARGANGEWWRGALPGERPGSARRIEAAGR